MTANCPHTDAARQAKRLAADAAGIDHGFIDVLVEQFYARVRRDELLGPVFASRIQTWPPHLERMKRFWAVILRGEGRFSGSPMTLHAAIPDIETPHFERWLDLFEQTLLELEGNPVATGLALGRARSIANSLLAGIRLSRDIPNDGAAMKGAGHA